MCVLSSYASALHPLLQHLACTPPAATARTCTQSLLVTSRQGHRPPTFVSTEFQPMYLSSEKIQNVISQTNFSKVIEGKKKRPTLKSEAQQEAG